MTQVLKLVQLDLLKAVQNGAKLGLTTSKRKGQAATPVYDGHKNHFVAELSVRWAEFTQHLLLLILELASG